MTSALEFESSWSLGEIAYQAILEDLRSFDAKSIVEFGSGTSTLRLSRDLPKATIFSKRSRSNLRLSGAPESASRLRI